jgi:hypothetical protein
MTARESIHELLQQYESLDDLGKVAMSGALAYAAGIIRGGLEAQKSSRAVMEQRIAEADRRLAEREAKAAIDSAKLHAEIGLTPSEVRELISRGRARH